jgi:hypothetical protein
LDQLPRDEGLRLRQLALAKRGWLGNSPSLEIQSDRLPHALLVGEPEPDHPS